MTLKSEEVAVKNWLVKQWQALTPTSKCLLAAGLALVLIVGWVVV